ncbi:MAG: histidine phosphatase family protein [Brevirhabdus sp.]
MTRFPDIYFLRHGQSTWNRDDIIQGQKDVPLTDAGYDHARAQGRILASLGLPGATMAIASPLERARETARVACGIAGLEVTLDARLKEMGFGSWEGRYKPDLAREFPELATRRLFEVCMEGPGESFESLKARCAAVLAELTGPTVIVSHGIAITMMRGLVRGLDLKGMARLDRPQGVVIAWRNGREELLGEAGERGENSGAI